MSYVIGSAHGRFQPLHFGHLEYLTSALERCDFLWIGITQFTTAVLRSTPEDPHRVLPFNNPLSYHERATLIRQALLEIGTPPSAFATCPFPIEQPELLSEFLAKDVRVFTTVYDQWNRHKINVLRDQGYEVEILWERPESEKQYKGSDVRALLSSENPAWQELVPQATIAMAERLDLGTRLQRLKAIQAP